MAEFLHLITPHEFLQIVTEQVPLQSRGGEVIPFTDALHRVIARDLYAPVDLPPFTRSTVDGFAVRAMDTAGATETLPGYLSVAGEVLMGEGTDLELLPGQAAKIPTGGMLPKGADAVMMVEYTDFVDAQTIEFTRSLAPGENMVRKGEDIVAGQLLLPRGHRIRPQEVGALAGLGITEVEVFLRPVVVIFSTGDELISPDKTPKEGEIRDINTYSIGAYLQEMGCIVRQLGIIEDDYESIRKTVAMNRDADLILLSGGSSVGVKDMTVDVLNSFEKPGVIVHGVAIKPGKPTILAMLDRQPVVGLPGHPASAWTVFHILIKPMVQILKGERTPADVAAGREQQVRPLIRAVISRNVVSDRGREEYVPVRVRLDETQGYIADPILGKSSLITTLVQANGYVRVAQYQEGLYQGETVSVRLF